MLKSSLLKYIDKIRISMFVFQVISKSRYSPYEGLTEIYKYEKVTIYLFGFTITLDFH